MAQQGQSFDLSKISTANKIVGASAAVYFIWSLLPVWYSLDLGPFGSDSASGFRGFTIIAALLALVAVAEIVVRLLGMNVNLPAKRGLVHLVIAVIAVVCTLLGLITRPSVIGATYGVSWGLFVALVISLVWAYGAYMMYSEPAPAPPAGGMGMG